MDAADFTELRRAVAMVSLMGADAILCGLRPGVAASLVDLGVPIDGLRTMLNLDTALAQVTAREPQSWPAAAREQAEQPGGAEGRPLDGRS
jgi:hypothetical protein